MDEPNVITYQGIPIHYFLDADSGIPLIKADDLAALIAAGHATDQSDAFALVARVVRIATERTPTMSLSTVFPVTIVYVDDQPPVDGVLFVAPRPLMGAPCDYAPLSNWAGLVTLPHPEMRADWQTEALDYNRRMDARVVSFCTKQGAINAARQAIETELDGPCPDYIDDDILLDHYRTQVAPTTVVVTAHDDGRVTAAPQPRDA